LPPATERQRWGDGWRRRVAVQGKGRPHLERVQRDLRFRHVQLPQRLVHLHSNTMRGGRQHDGWWQGLWSRLPLPHSPQRPSRSALPCAWPPSPSCRLGWGTPSPARVCACTVTNWLQSAPSLPRLTSTPLGPSNVYARMETRSTTPRWASSSPMGNCTRTTRAPHHTQTLTHPPTQRHTHTATCAPEPSPRSAAALCAGPLPP